MGMSSGGGDDLNAEINVTPLVDVMLVLLIIFMITAPVMSLNTGVDVTLPAVTAQNIEDPEGKLVLAISETRKIALGGTQIPWADLKAKLSTNERLKKEGALYVSADKNLPYAVVVTAMAVARDAGVGKVMLLTDPTDTLKLSDLDQTVVPPGASGSAVP